MRQEIAKMSSNAAIVPAAAIKLAQQANREHQRATRSALNAIEHAIKSGQALIKARELCEYGVWGDFIAEHFDGSMRTAQQYMRLAHNWHKLATQDPAAVSSQRYAAKALTAILVPDKSQPRTGARKANAQRAAHLMQNAASRHGPVWRASGPFVAEAMDLVSSIEASLSGLVARGYPLEAEAKYATTVIERLQTMLDKEIDEAEALQAAGEWTFVDQEPPPVASTAAPSSARKEADHAREEQ